MIKKNSADKKVTSAKENSNTLEDAKVSKYAFYKNMHPTLEMICEKFHCINEYWTEDIADSEKTDQEVLEGIAETIAEFCMGQEYVSVFDDKLELLPEDLCHSFMTDAQKIMDELKTDSSLLRFQNEQKQGIYPNNMPPKAVWKYEDRDGNRLVKTFSFITHIYEEIEADNTGFIKRIHRQFPDGYCLTHVFDKENGGEKKVIAGYVTKVQPAEI